MGVVSVDVGPGRLHAEVLADGVTPAIVLLHGFGASSTTWSPMAGGLAATGHRVVAFDRLGFGDSDRPRRPAAGWGPGGSPYRPSAGARHTLAVLDALGVGTAVLIGHSAGAVTAVLVALEAPERVGGLGLVAPALLRGGPPPLVAAAFSVPGAAVVAPWVLRRSTGLLVRGLRSAWHDPARVTAEVVERYRAPLRRPGWEHALVEMTRAVEPLRLADRLPEIRTRAVVVAGASDRVVRLPEARQVAELLGSELVVVPEAGHLVHEERPADVLAALSEGLGLRPAH